MWDKSLVDIYGTAYTDCINRGGHQTTRTLLDAATKEACEAVASHIRETECEPLRKALEDAEEYLQHDSECAINQKSYCDDACDCGLFGVRERIEAILSTKGTK